ncbi:metal-sensitive transcriptional regulator [Paenibacillus sp. LHD-117]|uniref:metal-sensitive transcriptional regulator n=1 Tax=Paenibacillus sp. LHD-117 TaxID=3071412 RepID=UPI0027DEC57F|nr:metal-sensitive transcriptional regulator [Paenibacillus sp. LHD-117]MDQ6422926.1 metal-sensitive transcriptional regulator [Paenibacillus sp. LHD-117]
MDKYEYDDSVRRRLKRMEGQIRGVMRMMDEGKECQDVVTQLSAVRSAVDKAMAHIVASNLERCIVEEKERGGDTGKLVKEAVELLVRSR